MIIQISHLALASSQFQRDIEFFTSQGYSVQFTQFDAPNPAIKRELLSHYSPVHDLCLMKRAGSYPVELLNHHASTGQTGYLTPRISGLSAEYLHHPLSSAITPDAKDSNEVAFNQVVVQSCDPIASKQFWRQLGFQPDPLVENRLLFLSPFQKTPLSIEIQEIRASSRPYCLDDTGFNCLAVISTSTPKTREQLERCGFRVTKIETFTANGQDLLLFFATGPGGELVEVLSLIRS